MDEFELFFLPGEPVANGEERTVETSPIPDNRITYGIKGTEISGDVVLAGEGGFLKERWSWRIDLGLPVARLFETGVGWTTTGVAFEVDLSLGCLKWKVGEFWKALRVFRKVNRALARGDVTRARRWTRKSVPILDSSPWECPGPLNVAAFRVLQAGDENLDITDVTEVHLEMDGTLMISGWNTWFWLTRDERTTDGWVVVAGSLHCI